LNNKFKKSEQKDPRSELAKDLRDIREILRNDGDYTPEVNKNLLEEAKKYENKFENVFQKGEPK
jgi:hypothetical protein